MVPAFLAGTVLKAAAKGLISEKIKIKIVVGLGDLLVKSTKNKLDDKVWKKARLLLLPKK